MDEKQQLRLQAFFDGELPEAEMRELAAWVAANPEAAALQLELQNTRAALSGFEQDLKLPESREFFWSKIEREIQRSEKPQPAKAGPSLFAWLGRILIPAGGLALVAVVLLLSKPSAAQARPEIEMTLSDSGAFTYRDEQSGTTVVWFSYGSENGGPDGADLQP